MNAVNPEHSGKILYNYISCNKFYRTAHFKQIRTLPLFLQTHLQVVEALLGADTAEVGADIAEVEAGTAGVAAAWVGLKILLHHFLTKLS